jgi:formate dehydrogenase maturation protein FdhE
MAWCQFTHILSVPKGVIWLLLAATAEVPPVVGSACFNCPLCSSPPSASQVLLGLNLNGSSFLSPPYH